MFGAGWRFRHHGDQDLKKLARRVTIAADWHDRATRIRQGILRGAGLVPFPRPGEMHPVVHSRRSLDGYVVENVSFESMPGFHVTGNLYTPAPGSGHGGRRPAMLKPHGHFKDGRFRPDNQFLCAGLARHGCVVFTYDMVGYGESTQVQHKDGSVLALQLVNSTRALDFLESLDMVDPARIGITGASGGGTQSFLLGATDDRVALSAPVLMVSSKFFGGCSCESGMPVHKGPGFATNNAEIAATMAPKPQLVVSCGTDWTRSVPWVEFPFMRRVYGLLGADDAVENVHLPAERHDLGPSKRQAVYAFLAKHGWIEHDPGTPVDERNVTIEDPAVMRAFDDAHPRPGEALEGEAAVLARLRELQAGGQP